MGISSVTASGFLVRARMISQPTSSRAGRVSRSERGRYVPGVQGAGELDKDAVAVLEGDRLGGRLELVGNLRIDAVGGPGWVTDTIPQS